MSTWIPCTLIIPIECQDAANRLAAIIDPDTGGGLTFDAEHAIAFSETGEEPATHHGTEGYMYPVYTQILLSGDPEMVQAALTGLATEYGREPPTAEDCAAFTGAVVCRPEEGLMAVAAELNLVRL